MRNFLIFILLPLSLLLDIFTETVFETKGVFAIVRAVIYYSFIIYAFIYGLRRKNNVNAVFVTFFLYVSLQIPFSNEPVESLRISLKILMSIMIFPVGYYFINDFKKLKVLNKSVVFLMAIYILNYVISQYFGIGTADYTKGKDFVLGSLADSWNNITYMLLVIPAILLTEKNKKLVYILASILIVLLIISLKRIAVLGACIGYVIYVIKTGKVLKSLAMSLVFITLFFAALPIFESVLIQRYEARGSKLSGGSAVEIIEKEGRFLETFAVLEETISLEKPIKTFFGLQAFYSVGNYANGSFGERQLHIDYNLILNTIGIIGLLLYFKIFYYIYKKRIKVKKYLAKNRVFLELESVFYMLLLTQFITSFGGQMYALTFRAIIFLYLGAILGVMYKQAEHNLMLQKCKKVVK